MAYLSILVQQQSNTIPNVPQFFGQASDGKDNTQYSVDGVSTGGKGQTVRYTIEHYVKTHTNISFSDGTEVFVSTQWSPANMASFIKFAEKAKC